MGKIRLPAQSEIAKLTRLKGLSSRKNSKAVHIELWPVLIEYHHKVQNKREKYKLKENRKFKFLKMYPFSQSQNEYLLYYYVTCYLLPLPTDRRVSSAVLKLSLKTRLAMNSASTYLPLHFLFTFLLFVCLWRQNFSV